MILGRITAPYGVKGWVRVRPDSKSTASLLRYRSWWVGDGASWRERDVAPEEMEARGSVSGIKRPVCAYPAYAKYDGSGDLKDAASFRCVTD